jgi:Flp pilus assembly protein TadG
MVQQSSNNRPRRGATLVETALVLPVVLMMLFGIFEYGRFMFLYTTATNAVRDGARYAAVRTGSTTSTTTADVVTVVNNKMGGLNGTLGDYKVEVYFADPAKLALTTPEIDVHPSYKPYNASANSWKETSYGDKIAVVMTGDYRPTMAQLLALGNNTVFKLRVISLMTSEGN